MPATLIRSSYRTVVGGRPIDTTASTDPGGGRIFDDFGGAATGQ